jgi:hypothetical protein
MKTAALEEISTELSNTYPETSPDPEKPTSTEVFWEHPNWLFVIIPVQMGYRLNSHTGVTDIPKTFPLLAAYCKRCGSYFTQPLAYNQLGYREGREPLPKYGCVGPEEL